ncbi:MAG: PAS domain-containing protein, partial [Planctomycetia bacterium]|nr:PAS domain-containing protein [Planctomycetia bacterium]
DDDFRYIQCNENFASFIGRPKKEILGHTDMELFPRVREKEHFRNWDSKIMDEGKVQEFYEEAQGANRYYHFQTVKMPFTDAQGNRLLIGLAVDISAYKKAEEERNAAQLLLNKAFAAMPIILYVKSVEKDFRYIQCNENFCKLFGKTEKEILGRSDEEIFLYPHEVTAIHATDRQAMESGQSIEIIETLSGADNKTYHFRTVKMGSTDVEGNAILIGMAVNITEMIEQREQMQASQSQLQAGCLMTRSFTFEIDEHQKISTTNGLYTDLIPHVDGKPLAPMEWILPEDVQATEPKLEAFFSKQCDEITMTFRTDWFGKRRYYKSIITREDSGVYGVTSDVTELFETAEEVRTSAIMWKQIMDELPVRFFVKDTDDECRYIMSNKANADFLGLTEEEIIGKTTEEICKPSRAITDYLQAERQILVDHKVSHARINIPDASGVIREMEKIEMPIAGVKNRSLLVSIAFDITEREQSLRLAEISARILAGVVREPDFRKVLIHIGETTTEILNCRRVIFAKCDDKGYLHFFQDAGVDPNYHFSQQAIALHEYYWNCYLDRLNNNELIMFERMGDDPSMEPLFIDYPEYRKMALVGTPVVVDGKLHGVMIITFHEPHAFSENDIRTLRAICDCIVLAENRSQQNEALL